MEGSARPVGRQGYPLRALWRAYLLSFLLNLPHTNALIRRLHADTELRRLCGYDSTSNYQNCGDCGAAPIIGIRRTGKQKAQLHEGIYTNDAAPTCIGMQPMEYVRSHGGKRLYRCPPSGCHLRARRGVRYCDERVWESGHGNPRLFGPIPRGSAAWKDLYGMRQSVERVFKSLKESRRLAAHCLRGLRQVSLPHRHERPSVSGHGAGVSDGRPTGRHPLDGQEGGVSHIARQTATSSRSEMPSAATSPISFANFLRFIGLA